MDLWGKWLRSKLVAFMVIYWGAIIVLTYSLEWIARHAAAFGVAGFVVGTVVLVVLVLRWRRSRYW